MQQIPNSWLQAGALVAVAALGLIGALNGQWPLVGTCVTGFFAVLAIHPKDGAPPSAGAPDPQ